MTVLPDSLVGTPPAGMNARRDASWRLWAALGLVLLAVTVGLSWDRAYHATNPFESFWSPPHLFIYLTSGLAFAVAASVALSAPLRRTLGPDDVRLPLLPLTVPGPLALLLGGFVVLGVGGTVLDQFWHTLRQLDETPWSTPHAMIGQGICLLALGFAACRLALADGRPLGVPVTLLLGYLLLATSHAWLGPLNRDATPEMVRALMRVPALAAQPPAQHAFRIVRDWNLTHASPLLIPLGALAAGLGLSLVRAVARRWWVLLGAVLVYTLFAASGERRTALFLDRFAAGTLSPDPRNWLPLPVLPAALVLLVLDLPAVRGWLGRFPALPWLAAGLSFGLAAWLIWRAPLGPPLALLTAPPAALLGARAGAWIGATLHRPTPHRVALLLGLLGVALPLATGAVDLALRTLTP